MKIDTFVNVWYNKNENGNVGRTRKIQKGTIRPLPNCYFPMGEK